MAIEHMTWKHGRYKTSIENNVNNSKMFYHATLLKILSSNAKDVPQHFYCLEPLIDAIGYSLALLLPWLQTFHQIERFQRLLF